MKTITLEVIDVSEYFKKILAKHKGIREDDSSRGGLAGLAEQTKAKSEAARKLAAEKEAASDKKTSDNAGKIFDLAVAAAAAAAAVPTGGASLAAVPGIIGTGMIAKEASKGIREGLMEGDLEKGLSGVAQAGSAYASGKGIQTASDKELLELASTQGYDALDDDQINRLLELDELKRSKS